MLSIEPAGVSNEVTALFAGSAVSFGLSQGATLADLVERLDNLGGGNSGTPKAVYLKLAWPGTTKCMMTMLSSETEGNF
nr:hypothetical protein [uncultured Rhodopila sp.]